LKICFITSSSKLPSSYQNIIDDYCKKISFWIPAEFSCLDTKVGDRSNKEKKIKAEEEKFLKFIKPDDFVVLFDERGTQLDSKDFAKKIENIFSGGKKRLVFIIGGAFGVGDLVKKRSNMTISFSKMVFNHHIAVSVAVEQMYRAMTILHNVQYHNE
jgi:23S rRNA (pseudouridine1915-N3)-methyltransferase